MCGAFCWLYSSEYEVQFVWGVGFLAGAAVFALIALIVTCRHKAEAEKAMRRAQEEKIRVLKALLGSVEVQLGLPARDGYAFGCCTCSRRAKIDELEQQLSKAHAQLHR